MQRSSSESESEPDLMNRASEILEKIDKLHSDLVTINQAVKENQEKSLRAILEPTIEIE
jgi:hypothetical protein